MPVHCAGGGDSHVLRLIPLSDLLDAAREREIDCIVILNHISYMRLSQVRFTMELWDAGKETLVYICDENCSQSQISL